MTTAKPTCPFCLMEMKRSHDVVGESPNFWCVCPAFGKNVVSQEDLEEFCAAVMEMRRNDVEAGAYLAGENDAGLFECLVRKFSKSPPEQLKLGTLKTECDFFKTQTGCLLETEFTDYIDRLKAEAKEEK